MEVAPEVTGHEEDDKKTKQYRDPDRSYLQRMNRVIIIREDVDVREGMGCGSGN